jgi:hypothetical protein
MKSASLKGGVSLSLFRGNARQSISGWDGPNAAKRKRRRVSARSGLTRAERMQLCATRARARGRTKRARHRALREFVFIIFFEAANSIRVASALNASHDNACI